MTIPPARADTAVLEIDLDAVAANWHALQARHPSGPVAGVLKADGYGLGAAHVGRRLYREGCRHFFVAHLAEAVALRPSLPDAMIAVLNGLPPTTAATFMQHNLLPVLGSMEEIAAWRAAAATADRTLPAMLHVDTGMARLGLAPDDLARLRAEPDRMRGIALRYVMTHLVAAECPGDAANERQRARFLSACAMFPGVKRSLSNSSGLFLGDAFGSDLARPGAAMYGVNPTPGRSNPMQATVRLRARVIQLRVIEPGDTVGYNATWIAARPSRIATVGVGYADGWLRSLSNRGAAYFDGARLPLVGRVSMDLTTFDATDVPALRAGDWLDLIGPNCPVDSVAEAAGTNGYEVLTSLGHRYARVHVGT